MLGRDETFLRRKKLVGRARRARAPVFLQGEQLFTGVPQGEHDHEVRHLRVLAKPFVLRLEHFLGDGNDMPGLLGQLLDLLVRRAPPSAHA